MPFLKLIPIMLLCALPVVASSNPSMECGATQPDTSQVGIGNCLAKMQSAVDDTIRGAFISAMQRAVEIDKITQRASVVPALFKSQSVWLSYRDAHCDFVGTTFGGGSGTGIAKLSCRIELGRARVKELENHAP